MILQSPGGGHGNALQYSCLEHPHGQRSLVGYIPWGHKELDMSEWISTASTISLLALYLDNSLIWKDICTPTFIAALFTIAKTRKQPKYPSTDEWRKMSYVYVYHCCCVFTSIMPDSVWPYGLQLGRLFCPCDSLGKSTGVGCHAFLRRSSRPRNQTHVSCIAGRFFTAEPLGKPVLCIHIYICVYLYTILCNIYKLGL